MKPRSQPLSHGLFGLLHAAHTAFASNGNLSSADLKEGVLFPLRPVDLDGDITLERFAVPITGSALDAGEGGLDGALRGRRTDNFVASACSGGREDMKGAPPQLFGFAAFASGVHRGHAPGLELRRAAAPEVGVTSVGLRIPE